MNFELSSNLGDMIGLLGVAVYLVSYLVLQLGLVSGQSMVYAAANIVAAGSVLFSLSYQFNLSSALIQTMWILISLIGISRLYLLHKTTSFSADEKAFLSSKFPGLPIDQARKLLRSGAWMNGVKGQKLATQGEKHDRLIYLLSGQTDIDIDGHRLGKTGPDSFLGELTVMDDQPATASATLTGPARYFVISGEKLRLMANRSGEFNSALSASFAGDIREKLHSRNRDEVDLRGSAGTA